MKKVISIFVLVSYMLCAFGVSLSFHQCAGEFKYLSVNEETKHEVKCCKGSEDMPDGCCKTHMVKYKKADDKAQSYFTIIKKDISEANDFIPSSFLWKQTLRPVLLINSITFYRPPPDALSDQPLYILHSVFRI